MTKSIVLCADDYGQAPAINEGIIDLLQKQRLSAVSCLVNVPLWPASAAKLKDFASMADIGLHFNLTEGKALSSAFQSTYGEDFPALGTLMLRSFLRRLDKDILMAECRAQLDAFQAAIGIMPRFIDGHQHVHQFPIIRDALLAVYEERLRRHGTYVRLALPRISSYKQLKQVVIIVSGGMAFRRNLKRLKIPHNASFSGSYAFSEGARYREYFTIFLDEVQEGGLIMCHPARAEVAVDPIASARLAEYRYLASEQFLQDCAVKGVKIKQFSLKASV